LLTRAQAPSERVWWKDERGEFCNTLLFKRGLRDDPGPRMTAGNSPKSQKKSSKYRNARGKKEKQRKREKKKGERWKERTNLFCMEGTRQDGGEGAKRLNQPVQNSGVMKELSRKPSRIL